MFNITKAHRRLYMDIIKIKWSVLSTSTPQPFYESYWDKENSLISTIINNKPVADIRGLFIKTNTILKLWLKLSN